MSLSNELPPFELEDDVRNYLIRRFNEVELEFTKPIGFTIERIAVDKPQIGNIYYFGDPANYNYDVAITAEGWWGYKSTGWVQLG